jgi:hypothetical protein
VTAANNAAASWVTGIGTDSFFHPSLKSIK